MSLFGFNLFASGEDIMFTQVKQGTHFFKWISRSGSEVLNAESQDKNREDLIIQNQIFDLGKDSFGSKLHNKVVFVNVIQNGKMII